MDYRRYPDNRADHFHCDFGDFDFVHFGDFDFGHFHFGDFDFGDFHCGPDGPDHLSR